MTGKEKCEFLRQIRKNIAEANNIVFLSAECYHEGDCKGTCPICDAEIRFLDAELNRKAGAGEKITISGMKVPENYYKDIEKLDKETVLEGIDDTPFIDGGISFPEGIEDECPWENIDEKSSFVDCGMSLPEGIEDEMPF